MQGPAIAQGQPRGGDVFENKSKNSREEEDQQKCSLSMRQREEI
jgi:hypothetical protein